MSATLHVIGAGPVGRSLLRALEGGPYRVRAVSDTSGTVFDRDRVDVAALAEHKVSGGRYAERAGAALVPLESLLSHGTADIVVDCTASELARGPEAIARADAALGAGSSVVFAAKHALATEPLSFLEPLRSRRIGINAVLGGTGLALQEELEDLLGAVESVAIVGNTSTTAVIEALERGASLEAALARAREAGYLEADASRDLDGTDAAAKLAIVASLLTGARVRVDDIERPAFDRLDPDLLAARRRKGRTTRLVGRLRGDGAVSLAYEELPAAGSLSVPPGRVAYAYRLRQGGTRIHIGSGVGTHGTVRALLTDVDAAASRGAPPRAASEAVSVTPGAEVFAAASPLPLVHGGRLDAWRLGFEIEGPEEGPVILVQGGISSGRHVCRTARDPSPGWWDAVVGPGRAVDTSRYRVLSTDFLGGTGASSGPSGPGESFPVVTSHDQAEAIVRLLDALGIETVHACIGASYGGMVGLALAERHPRRVGRLIVFGAPERAHPAATAARALQRRILRLGLARGFPREAVILARALAMTTYRSPAELRSRFDAPPEWRDAEPVFPVERYLESRGADFARTATPRSYATLLRAIDLHRVRGESIRVPTLLIGATTDVLVPIEQIEELAAKIPCARRLVRIPSRYGHDAFLKETETLGPVIQAALQGARP